MNETDADSDDEPAESATDQPSVWEVPEICVVVTPVAVTLGSLLVDSRSAVYVWFPEASYMV